MKMTGVEVPLETLSKKIKPNTVFIVASDDQGAIKAVKVDHDSIPLDEPIFRVEAGCFVRVNGKIVWKDPCPK